MKLKIVDCYALAWRSFSKWWIPLCLISGFVVAFQIAPRFLVSTDLHEFSASTLSFLSAALEGNDAEILRMAPEVSEQSQALLKKLGMCGLVIFPVIALLTIVLLMNANWAVKDKRGERRPFFNLAHIALVHVMMAIGKLMAFFVFVPLGAYVYIKLLFVSLIMLEEKKGATAAMRISWRMTDGNFWRLFLLMFMNTVIQTVAMPTIIGGIPATGFANTARAAAFRMLRDGIEKTTDHTD
jgi:hypothetical protein